MIGTTLCTIIKLTVTDLEAEGVHDHGAGRADVEMQDREAQLLEAGRKPQKLPWPPRRLNLDAGVPLHHARFDVGGDRR